MRSFCGVYRLAPSCPPPPPRCIAHSQLLPSPHPHCSPPHLEQGATPPLTAMAALSRLSTAPHPTEPPPIKISPRAQPHPHIGRQAIRITPLAQPRLHTECQPIVLTLQLVSTLCRDKHSSLSFLEILHFLHSPLSSFPF